jgi:exopolyphosphatase/guanosine-5'-triphosphate,3'-diphosphate pyrophosphatase
MQRIAILDLGTNTFNLLVAEKGKDGNPVFIYSKELPVELGKGGIHKAHITAEAIERAIKALHAHRKTMTEHGIKDQYAFATSAVRGAENKKEFTERVCIETGIEINILSGEEEAKWIYEGVKHASVLGKHTSVIMDIGGGSTEFIFANDKEIFWKKSYPLGVTRLYEIFRKADPLIHKQEEVKEHITDMLQDMFAAGEQFRPVNLIGSSGSFDSFAEILQARIGGKQNPGNGFDFPMDEFEKLHHLLMSSTVDERLKMKGLIEMRAPMFAYSSILTKTVLDKLAIKQMRLSHYALKEGIAGHLLAKL